MMQLEGQGELFAIAPDPLIYTNGEAPTHCVKCREKLTMAYEGAGGKGYRWEKCQKCARTPDPKFSRKLHEAVKAAREAAETEETRKRRQSGPRRPRKLGRRFTADSRGPRLPQPSLDSWGSPGQGGFVPLINAGPKHFAQLLRGGRVKVVPHTMDSDLDALLLVISGKSNAHMATWPVLRLRRLMSLCDRLADHFHLLTFSL